MAEAPQKEWARTRVVNEKVRVLVVDDSETSRNVLRLVLEADQTVEVVGLAKDGIEAVELAAGLKPDLITMDILMPGMDGCEATELIMAENPTPILVITASPYEIGLGTRRAFRALQAGALDIINKPSVGGLDGANANSVELLRKVKSLSRIKVITHLRGGQSQGVHQHPVDRSSVVVGGFKAVAIAASTGGPRALQTVLSGLPAGIDAGFVVAQHIAEGHSRGLVEWLNEQCLLSVTEAVTGDEVQRGHVLVCPATHNMKVSMSGAITLTDATEETIRPSGDLLLASVGQAYGERALGIILTGMGRDGAEGAKSIKDRGGQVLVQDRKTSIMYGMPGAAIELKVVDKVLPLDKISQRIVSLTRRKGKDDSRASTAPRGVKP